MHIRPLPACDRPAAWALVWQVFCAFEAPDYGPEGTAAFRRFLWNSQETDALDVWGAYEGQRLLGVLATRRGRRHIALCFVDGDTTVRASAERSFGRCWPSPAPVPSRSTPLPMPYPFTASWVLYLPAPSRRPTASVLPPCNIGGNSAKRKRAMEQVAPWPFGSFGYSSMTTCMTRVCGMSTTPLSLESPLRRLKARQPVSSK